MSIFAGDRESSGYIAIARFIGTLPEEQQEKAADAFMKILNGSLWELWQVAREKDGLSPVTADESTRASSRSRPMRWPMPFSMARQCFCSSRDLSR